MNELYHPGQQQQHQHHTAPHHPPSNAVAKGQILSFYIRWGFIKNGEIVLKFNIELPSLPLLAPPFTLSLRPRIVDSWCTTDQLIIGPYGESINRKLLKVDSIWPWTLSFPLHVSSYTFKYIQFMLNRTQHQFPSRPHKTNLQPDGHVVHQSRREKHPWPVSQQSV